MFKISQVQYVSIDQEIKIFQDCPKPMAVTVNEQTYIYNDPDSFNVMEFGVKKFPYSFLLIVLSLGQHLKDNTQLSKLVRSDGDSVLIMT